MSTSEEAPSPNLRQKHVRQLMKTEMCKFFLANRCGKGSRCAFAHTLAEIREKPNLNRTSMCKTFLQTGNCDNPVCTYAHDERELRTTDGFFRTKLCRFVASGRCKHGAACRFAHRLDQLTPEARAAMEGEGGLLHASEQNSADGSGLENLQQQQRDEFAAAAAAAANSGRPMQQGGDWADFSSDLGARDGVVESDQSTRADTSASVPTPEGSGDSDQGLEDATHLQRRGAAADGRRTARTGGDRGSGRHCTTMMITNVPNFLTQGAIVSLLEDLTVCMRGAFDFFYCPWDPYQDRNLGYTIINFLSRATAAEFERQWSNQPLLPRTHGTKKLRIVPAALQGRAANLRHFSGFSLAHHSDPRFRPLVRAAPDEPLRPMAISEEMLRQVNPQASPEMFNDFQTMPHAKDSQTGVGMVQGWDLAAAAASAARPGFFSEQVRSHQPDLFSLLGGNNANFLNGGGGGRQAHHQKNRHGPAAQQLSAGPSCQSAAGIWEPPESTPPFVIVPPGAEADWFRAPRRQAEQSKGLDMGATAGALDQSTSAAMPVPPQCWALLLPPGAAAARERGAGLGLPNGGANVAMPYYHGAMPGMPYLASEDAQYSD